MTRPATRCVPLILALLLASTTAGRAQQRVSALFGPRLVGPIVPATFASTATPTDLGAFNARLRAEIQPTRWLTGGAIGGTVLGVLTGVLVAGLCEQSDIEQDCVFPTIGGALVGGALGFTVGALIGGQFPKAPPAPTQS
jgi:hypothetical protein